MISFHNYSFRYASSSKFALRDINLKLFPGEFVLVVGDSGSGKTTLLRSMNGLIPHFYGGVYEGSVRIEGREVRKTPPKELLSVVSSVFQDPENQVLMSTVEKEIAFPLENLGLDEVVIERRVEEVLDLLGIYHLRGRKISTLSGGEKQKVAIASAIATYPRYLFLDEPTSQIDPNSAEELLSLLERLNDDLGMGIILVEHRMERTMHRADRLIVMKEGRIIGDGEPRMIASKIDLDSEGVGYPQITRIARKIGMKYLPLTVKEGRKTLEKILKDVNPQEDFSYGDILVNVRSLYFSYGQTSIIKNLNLKIRRGEILGLMGRNGAGKTTMAKLLSGLLRPSRGEVRIKGKRIITLGERERSKLVSMVFQNPNLHLFQDTIEEDILFSVEDGKEKKAEKIMKELGIWNLRKKSGKELSGGERMLAAIATIAVREPELLILDEPTRGLSFKYKLLLSKFLRDYAKNRAVMLISHDVETVARTCNRVAILSRGRIIAEGNRREIMSSSLIYSTQLNKVVQGIENMKERKILIEEDLGVEL